MRLLLLLPAACSYAAYTPPARMMPLETADAPAAGSSDVQLELSRVGIPMGFAADTGEGSLRHGISDQVAVEASGGVTRVAGNAGAGVDRDLYQGRVGLHVHPRWHTGDATVAMTGGVGAGRSALAGRWVSADVGLHAETDGTHAALFWSVEGWGSHPIDPQPFQYMADDGLHGDVLSDSKGLRGTGGVAWWPKGRDSTALILGVSYGVAADHDGHDQVMALGAALRAKL